MSNPLASIWEELKVTPKPESKPKEVKVIPKSDHTEAKEIYAKYLEKVELLRTHQEYADSVVKETTSPGMTPVEPLAIMGTNGGPLLCDYCLKPIILEGGRFNNVPVDKAWKMASDIEKINWKSWIKGGMVVEVVENGTLRIYHGYYRKGDCDFLGKKERNDKEEVFVKDKSKINLLWKFVNETFEVSREEKNKILTDIVNVMFGFDPGFGVNVP